MPKTPKRGLINTGLRQVLHRHPGHVASHADAVVGAPVLGVYLRRIGEVQASERRPMVRHALRVVGADDGLGSIDAMVVARPDPGWVELRIYPNSPFKII